MSNNRDRFDELLCAELDGEISPSETLELEAILAADPELAAEARDQRALIGMMRTAGEIKAPADLTARALEAASNVVSIAPPPRRRMLPYALSAAAAILLFGAIGMLSLDMIGKESAGPSYQMASTEKMDSAEEKQRYLSAEPISAVDALTESDTFDVRDLAAAPAGRAEARTRSAATMLAMDDSIAARESRLEAISRARLASLISDPAVGVLIDTPWESAAQSYLDGVPVLEEEGQDGLNRRLVVALADPSAQDRIQNMLNDYGANPIIQGDRISIPYQRLPGMNESTPAPTTPDGTFAGGGGYGTASRPGTGSGGNNESLLPPPSTGGGGDDPFIDPGPGVPFLLLESEDDLPLLVESLRGEFLFVTGDRQVALYEPAPEQSGSFINPRPDARLYYVFQFRSYVDAFAALSQLERLFGPGTVNLELGSIELIGDGSGARVIVPRAPLNKSADYDF